MSRYDRFKRRVGPIAFILAMGLLIRETCQAPERYHGTVVLELGTSSVPIDQIDIQLTVGDDVTGVFHRKALPDLPITEMSFKVSMPEQRGNLQIDVIQGGARKRLYRTLHVEENSTVRVPLAADLAAP